MLTAIFERFIDGSDKAAQCIVFVVILLNHEVLFRQTRCPVLNPYSNVAQSSVCLAYCYIVNDYIFALIF